MHLNSMIFNNTLNTLLMMFILYILFRIFCNFLKLDSFIFNLNKNIFHILYMFMPPKPEQLTKWKAFWWGEDWEDYHSEYYCYIDKDPYPLFWDREKRMWWWFFEVSFYLLFYINKVINKYNFKVNYYSEQFTFIMSQKYQYKCIIKIYYKRNFFKRKVFLFMAAIYHSQLDINTEFQKTKDFIKICWALPLYGVANLTKIADDFLVFFIILFWLFRNLCFSYNIPIEFVDNIQYTFNLLIFDFFDINYACAAFIFIFIAYVYYVYFNIHNTYKYNFFYNHYTINFFNIINYKQYISYKLFNYIRKTTK